MASRMLVKSCDQLESSDLDGAKEQNRWKRLDFALSRALQGMVKSCGESFLRMLR